MSTDQTQETTVISTRDPSSTDTTVSAAGTVSVPISRSTTSPHKTSPPRATQTALLDTASPAVNATPVEMDGAMSNRRGQPRCPGDGDRFLGMSGGTLSPGDEEDIDGEFLDEREGSDGESGREPGLESWIGGGGGGVGRVIQQKRAAMLASRSKDPGVIVDVPQDPTAEEVQAAKSAEGVVTPAIPVAEGGGT